MILVPRLFLVACLSLACVVLALLLPGLAPAGYAFSAHMTGHLLLVAVAAPLLAIAASGSAYTRTERLPGWLLLPLPLSLLELIVFWGWHAPVPHEAARASSLWFALEQTSFFVTGLLLWLSVLGGELERRGAGVLALLLTSMHMTLLGALLNLSPRVLHGHAMADSTAAALADQQMGGMLMLLIGGVVYLAGGLYLMRGLLTLPSKDERPCA